MIESSVQEGIAGKVVVITGASSGLGEATARHLARRGTKLMLGARRLERLQALASELSLGEGAAVQTDVADREQVTASGRSCRPAARAHRRDHQQCGSHAALVLERGKVEDWDRMIDVNLKGVLYGIAAALPSHESGKRNGYIIIVPSVAGHKVRPG